MYSDTNGELEAGRPRSGFTREPAVEISPATQGASKTDDPSQGVFYAALGAMTLPLSTRAPTHARSSAESHVLVAGDADLQGGHGFTPLSRNTASTAAQKSASKVAASRYS